MARIKVGIKAASQEVLVAVVQKAHESITEGSPITGAPGQPVDIGTLKASWIAAFPEAMVGEITTNIVYAPPIEEGVGRYGPLTLRSQVGGFHSVQMTVAGIQQLVDAAVEESRGN
ncbi:MAG TPA: hypothetical protein DCQ64_04500 [Candidatus Rokubacteria bacterium]|nr:hypothetical protein [Candidatus Rokubacteria bacterium]